jgi:hypothetical protein
MTYDLTAYKGKEAKLFFRMDGEEAERHGAVCSIGFNMERGGDMQRFGRRRHMETPAFKADVNRIIRYLRGNGMETSPLRSHQDFLAFCRVYGGEALKGDGVNVPFAFGLKILSEGYSYYLRVHPDIGKIKIHAYDNRYLLPELAGKHELPRKCFSTLPTSGKRILIWRGQSGYDSFDGGVENRAAVRVEVDRDNARWGVTRAQEEAMLAGSMFGWDTPAAKAWRYNEDGRLKDEYNERSNKRKTRDDGAR